MDPVSVESSVENDQPSKSMEEELGDAPVPQEVAEDCQSMEVEEIPPAIDGTQKDIQELLDVSIDSIANELEGSSREEKCSETVSEKKAVSESECDQTELEKNGNVENKVIADEVQALEDVVIPEPDTNEASVSTTDVSDANKPSPKSSEGLHLEEESRSSFTADIAQKTAEDDALLCTSKKSKGKASSKASGIDEDSQHSVSSQKSSNKRKLDGDAGSSLLFPPENVFEYMWPVEKGEFYFLQEQISDYLNVKSFKRKYPDLPRRPTDKAEKLFLREKGVVNETQCELGLTALKSEDVMELMAKDYPDKYRDYIKLLREKEKQTMAEKHNKYINSVDRNKIGDVAKKAIKSAAEYNAHLNQERKEERRCCFDQQTYTIHYPISRNKKTETVKMGKYPIALLPGQYQDGYKDYTPEELKYLPLNTVLYGPVRELKNISQTMSDSSRSDSEDSTGSENSCSSSQGTHDDGSGESSSSSEKNDRKETSSNSQASGTASDKSSQKLGISFKIKDKASDYCKVCKMKSGPGKEEKNEPMVNCSVCEKGAHLTCLQLSINMLDALKTYPWQCTDCKTCFYCSAKHNEDKLLSCDVCDRVFHTFCVGVKVLPQVKWICKLCGQCSVCNVTQPGPNGSKAQWQYDSTVSLTVLNDPSTTKRKHVLCQSCSRRRRVQ